MTSELTVEFCDEWFHADPAAPFRIGREGDLVIDDNPYLHRRFLEIVHDGGMWWLRNVGATLAATVCDDAGGVQAWISPGAVLPIVFSRTLVRFTAGPTLYELAAHLSSPPYIANPVDAPLTAETTIGRVELTPDQKIILVALAERALRRGTSAPTSLPTNAAAAQRLGWALTRFNRKLDNVCSKLERAGVSGLHGDSERLASGRRGRLVEYALSAKVISAEDLPLLDEELARSQAKVD